MNFKEKLQSLNFPRKLGQTEQKEVRSDETGKYAGYHTVRWDGSQDAHVVPETVTARVVKTTDGDLEPRE